MPDMDRRLRRLSAARIAVYRQLNDLRPEEIGAIFDTIDYLEAENAALKARLVVDDAMVERAANAYNREILGVTNRPEIPTHPPLERELRCTRTALEAALEKENGK